MAVNRRFVSEARPLLRESSRLVKAGTPVSMTSLSASRLAVHLLGSNMNDTSEQERPKRSSINTAVLSDSRGSSEHGARVGAGSHQINLHSLVMLCVNLCVRWSSRL